MSRVVVTGLELVTSLGNDMATSWEALCQGKSGVSEIAGYDDSRFRVHFGAQLKDFDPTHYMDRKEVRRFRARHAPRGSNGTRQLHTHRQWVVADD